MVVITVTEHSRKELIAVEDGYRESEYIWYKLLSGLTILPPKLATGDGAMGFWNALVKVFPDTLHQRCLIYKTANVLASLPKSVQPKIKNELRDIWLAESCESADKVLDVMLVKYGDKYPAAMKSEELLAFYDFSVAQHWASIKDDESHQVGVCDSQAAQQTGE